MSSTTSKIARLKGLNDRAELNFSLNKGRMIIGSSFSSDIIIEDASVSSYHAFITCLDSGELLIKDLASEKGTKVNGEVVTECRLHHGDVLNIGGIELLIDLGVTQQIENNSEVKRSSEMVMIDGEECDIIFDDSNFSPIAEIPSTKIDEDFIEIEEVNQPVEVAVTRKVNHLEVINYVNGRMLEVTYIEMNDGDYFLTPNKKKKNDIRLNTQDRVKFFSIKNGEISFHSIEGLTSSRPTDDLNLQQPMFFTLGTEQVSLRLTNNAVFFNRLPLLLRNKKVAKQVAIVFSILFLPLLLLKTVEIAKEEVKPQEIAVIYRLPEPQVLPPEPMLTEVATSATTEEVKSPDNNPQQVEQTKVVAKADAPKGNNGTPKVAKATGPQKTKVTAAPPVKKAYSFKSKVSVASLVGDAPKLNASASASNNSKAEAFKIGSRDSGALSGTSMKVAKFNNKDVGSKNGKGSGASDYSANGLASKSGFDSSYMAPKRVTLNSMDPELVKKILREYIPQFRHCYQQELITNSEKIRGIIDMNFTISPDGKVARHKIKAKDAEFSKKGTDCMARVLSLIEFPRPKGGGIVDIRQPFNFTSDSQQI